MIITILSWGIMGFIFSVTGLAVNYRIKEKIKYPKCTFFDSLWLGIAAVAVYAQVFSLFYNIEKNAFFGLFICVVILLIVLKNEYINRIKEVTVQIQKEKKKAAICLALLGALIVAGAVFTIQSPTHYDTYLYHAQNIRWIEEYGVVKGLGNFHNRFAYNSAFMCIQALFSFSWCLDQSLHTLNGFLWIFMMFYGLGSLTLWTNARVYFSDILKVLIIVYLCNESVIETMSSPHTDMMAMLLVIYIFTRWIECLEAGEKNYFLYGLFCLLGVFAVTVKLSAAFILILVLKPAIILLKEKKWGVILGFIFSGLILLAPFLLRNIMISGYLVYPYASIDLFNVDWKMPASQVFFDHHEIVAWGRGLNDVSRYAEPVTVWLPIWLEKSSMFNRGIILLDFLLFPVSIGLAIYHLIRKKYDSCLILLCCLSLFCGWLFTAPLPRYGLIYMFLPPLVYVYIILAKLYPKLKNKYKFILGISIVFLILSIAGSVMEKAGLLREGNRLMPKDYASHYPVILVLWEGVEVYVPAEGDQVSYESFPSTPYQERLKLIELRGDDLEAGFRIRQEYKNRNISTYGYFLD